MKIYAIIPARYGSTRFPGKPLAPIAGKPMIRHVYEHALACPEVLDVFVATDDDRISECVRDFGGKTVMTKKGHPSGTDRIAEASQKMNLQKDDLIVNIQGDQPLFQPSSISQLIRPLVEDRDIAMSTLKYQITDQQEVQHPNHVKVVTDREGFALFFSRSPLPFYRDPKTSRRHFKHLGFYAYPMKFLTKFVSLPVGELESAEKLEQLRALEYGYRIKVVETEFDSVEVDTPEDAQKLEKLLAEDHG